MSEEGGAMSAAVEEPEHVIIEAPEGAGPGEHLTAALAAAQGEFPKIERGNTAEVRGKDGKAGYSYTYADLGAVLAAVRPVLSRHGLALVQRTAHGESGKVMLSTELRHVGGGLLDSEVELGQSPSNPQAFGGALTYLRRYEAVTLLGIAAEEDRDAQDVEPERRGGSVSLPPWANEATDDRKKELLEALTPMIGAQRAKALALATKDHFGVVPDLIVGFTKALATHHEAVSPHPLPDASGIATAQDVTAEAPDEPPEASEVEPEPDGPEPERPPAASVKEDDPRAAQVCICKQGLDTPVAERDALCPVETHGVPF